MRPSSTRATVLRGLLGLLLLACSDGGGSGNHLPPGSDVTQNASISLQESEMSAVFEGGRLALTTPLHLAGSRTVKGTFAVDLISLIDGHVEGSASQEFEGTDTVSVKVTLPLTPSGDDVAVLAGHTLNWRVDSSVGPLQGRRSLFQAWSRKTEIVAVGPDHFDVGAEGTIRIVARDPSTGAPRDNVPVRLTLVREGVADRVLAEGTTDGYGVMLAHVLADDAAIGPGNLRIDAATEEYSPHALAQVAVERSFRILVTTDKPLYQPGQTIHLRALALRKPALVPEAHQSLTFDIYDAKDNKIEHQVLETDDFGVAHTKLPLAREINMGTWRIAATLDDVTTEKTITVDRYTLPKFDVKIDLDQPVYLAGDHLHGTVTAKYFFGKNVVGGAVLVQASTVDAGENVFAELQGETNDEGIYAFDVNLPDYLVGLPIAQGGGLIEFSAQVTDTAGQARTVGKSVRVAKGPLEVSAVPESGALVPGLENRVYLRSVDALGQPVAATHTLTFNGEGLGDVTADAQGLAIVTLNVPAQPADPAVGYVLTGTTTDGNGHSVDDAFTLSADVNAVQGAVLLRTDRALYRVGDTAHVDVMVTGAPDRVYLDVIRGGQTVLTETLTPDAETGTASYDLDLGPDHAGALSFNAWYLAQGSSFRRDSKAVYVESADGLTVDVTTDRETYAPGDEATLNFHVTDAAGNGQAAALGLQGVDEAVYSLVEQRPGLERVYFQIEGELAAPKYQMGVPGLEDLAAAPGGSDDPNREAEAAVLFAGTDGAAPGLSLSTWAGTEARCIPFVLPAIQSLMEPIIADLHTKFASEGFDYSGDGTQLAVALNAIAPPVDPFGKAMRLTTVNGYQVKALSFGPDELEGTLDDVSVSFDFYELSPEVPGVDGEDGEFNGGAGGGPVAEPGAGGANGGGGGDEAAVRIRSNFPETLFVEPALITDGAGNASLTVPLADSITTWRITAMANSAAGLLGSAEHGVKVFQDFFVDLDVPATVTRGDEVGITLALYNYLDAPQTVNLQVQAGDWLTLLGDAQLDVDLAPNEVKGVRIPLRAERVGTHQLTVVARGTSLSDGVSRQMRVEPDGQKVEQIASGRLTEPANYTTQQPQGSVADSGKLLVRLYPGLLSQVLTGMDGILRMPDGCFEQTSSSTWPNVLVERYLKESDTTNPELEAKAMEYINTGYQRLLTFEVTGGGFQWFGTPPAHVVLTAYGLLEFTDMAAVRMVDEAMIARTKTWLLAQQQGDGHWEAGEGGLDETGQLRDSGTITAYVAFALAAAGVQDPALDRAAAWLGARRDTMGSYTMALYANFLAAWHPNDAVTHLVLANLAERVQDTLDHWETDEQTTTYANGDGAYIETTALATHALLVSGANAPVASAALGWLVTKRDPGGAWGSTASTVWTIKCLLRALSGGRDAQANATVRILLDGVERAHFDVTPETSDVMRQADLSDALTPGIPQTVQIVMEGEGNLTYDVVESWHMPWAGAPPAEGPLSISVDYDRTTLAVNDMVTAQVTIANNDAAFADMVMVDLGIPPGFALVRDDLEALKVQGVFSRYEATERQLLLYFTTVPAGPPIVFSYRLQATDPVRAQAPRNRVYSYYNPNVGADAPPVEFRVE